jgi:hypothetical protein
MPRMKRTIALVLLFVACGKDKEKSKPTPEPASKTVVESKPEPEKPKPATTAAAFGKTIGPFGKIEKLKLGMTEADAKAAAPELTDEPNALKYELVFENGVLAKIKASSTTYENLEKIVAEAWGPGTVTKGAIGEHTFWFSPSTHVRARADSSDLELDTYLPLEEFLGTDKVMLGVMPKAAWGVSLDDIKRDYAAAFKDGDLKHLVFPPTEFDREHVEAFLLYSERKKKVDNVSFEIADGPDQATTLAAFEKKWGKPKLLKSYNAKEDTMIFHGKNPLIEVERSVREKAWEVRIRAKDDACGGPCYKGL